ncbi:hypothetical protein F5Y16DRAFT_179429 [Xylariaceae sp. FL0255]|nr:hypothetical protein F5Y16DRAFT_179429 [Xylariaceae sp. FL0255]
MSLPKPTVPLTGCSVIFNNTLYTYSDSAFQSLALEEGAEWSTNLPSGESVNGGVCVGSTPADSSTAGFFVVGGTSSSSDYPGLQKFTYSTGQWETIMPQVVVTQDRLWHSATYLNSTDSILVYAGSQQAGYSGLSQQTFTITASAPYGVLSSHSEIAPSAIAPILLPWSESSAVMIGGNTWNTQIMIFDTTNTTDSAAGSWVNSGATLSEPISKNTTYIKGAIIQGSDGSKHLYTFDPTISPTSVNRTVLIDGTGAPVVASTPISKRMISRSADPNDSDWPTYNSTLAPTGTRTDYSLASDHNGLVVMSGGNQDDVLCMFDAYSNSWKNASQVLEADTFSIQSSPSSTTSAATSSSTILTTTSGSLTSSASTAAATTTTAAAAAIATTQHGLPTTAILGISLGSIFGTAFILILVLVILKRRNDRRSYLEAGHARRASGIPPDTKDYFHEDTAQASGGYFRGHAQQESQNSFSSTAMFFGKQPQKPVLQRNGSNEKKRMSHEIGYGKDFKSTIGRPQPQMNAQFAFLKEENEMAPSPEPMVAKPRLAATDSQDSALRRSSGWNRYWSGAGTPHLLGLNGDTSKRNTEVSQSSQYSTDMQHRITADSATVLPLHFDGPSRPQVNRVNSGSPTVSQYDPKIMEGQAGHIERPSSAVSALTSSSGYSSGIPPSVHDAWDPTSAGKPWGAARAPSSAYSRDTVAGSSSRQPQPPVSSDLSWLNLGESERHGRSQR